MTWRPLRYTALSALLHEWRVRIHTRRDIALLDGSAIRDLGVSPGQMVFESRKPFWRA